MALSPHRVRSGLLLLLAVAGSLAEDTPEKRLDLDLTLFDQHLVLVDGCLRALPESTESSVLDCIHYEDAAIDRCDRVYGTQLDACMTEAEKKPAASVTVSDLLPELQKIRKDLVSCFERRGIRPSMVGTMNEPLRRCGITQLHGMVPDSHIEEAENHMRDFMHDREDFHGVYPSTEKSDGNHDEAHVHDLPLNLPGGRWEVVPPARGDMVDMVHWLTEDFNIPDRLEPIWNGSLARLSYVLLRGQVNDTAWVVDQPWHQDRDTTEDLRISMAPHASGLEAGPLEVLPTSHRFHPRLRVPDAAFPRGRAIAPLDIGDMVFYFSRLRHRGAKRTGSVPRVSLDVVVHSTGRFFHPTSDRDPEKVYERFIQNQDTVAHNSTEKFKQLWEAGIQRARKLQEFYSRPAMAAKTEL